LSERLGGTAGVPRPWQGDVPAPLGEPLLDWVHDQLESCDVDLKRTLLLRVALRMNIDIGREIGKYAVVNFLWDNNEFELTEIADLVDSLLDLLPTTGSFSKERDLLQDLLYEARSALRVREDGRGLERRSDETAEAAYGQALASASSGLDIGSSAEHLRAAWEYAHALKDDPVRAYSEAIKAVEASAHAVIEPNNPKATLGTMLGHLRSNQNRFSLGIAGPNGQGDIQPLIGCLTLLWTGQSSRHGSRVPTRAETREEALIAVHLAVMLVQWFSAGAVQRI
jgi:hypothetical protein